MPRPVPIIKASTQDHLDIEDITNDLVLLQDGSACLILEVSALNFGLLSEKEQDATIYAYAQLLNSLTFSIQIVVSSKQKDISDYLALLDLQLGKTANSLLHTQLAKYRDFIKTVVRQGNVLDKKFYVAIPFSSLELGISSNFQSLISIPKKSKELPKPASEILERAILMLSPRRDHLVRLLTRIGLRARQLTSPELIQFFFNSYHRSQIETKVTAASAIAPQSITVDFNTLKIDDWYFRSLFVAGYPRFVTANWLAPLINFDHSLNISMFVYPVESKSTLDDLRRKIAEMEAEISTDLQRGRVVDPSTQAKLEDALTLQEQLVKGAERFFQFGLYATIPAKSESELNQVTKQVSSTLGSLLITTAPALLQQADGFKTTLPTCIDHLMVTRNMDTTSLATTFPFTSSELTSNEGVLYGLNEHNGSLVIFDRFSLENANTVLFAKAGAGKSYLVKLEILRSLMFGTEILVIDPENEYKALCDAVGGEYINFGFNSPARLNPFDLSALTQYSDENELNLKIMSLHSLFKVIMGTLTPTEEAILDRALVATYKMKGITPDAETQKKTPPLMEDLYKALIGMEEPLSQTLADRIEKFVKGSFRGIIDQPSNVNLKNPFTVFSVRDLEDSLKPIAIFIILDYIWTKMRRELKKRILVVDEAWYLMRSPDSAAFLYGIAKRARKYFLGLTTITQDVDDFLTTDYGKAIVTNSSIQILMKQSPAAIDKVAQVFYLSEGEKHLLLSSEVGEGLFFAGNNHVAIRVVASPDEHKLVTTKPSEILRQQEEPKVRLVTSTETGGST
ncbi:MAG: Type IV secretory pathway VirB4 component-like protein [Candidatus Amesbacteria bacterium GW2011_GWB1_47_26]|uniref:Type IV secretory pathway VirB4 component-like protein n=1 Tax=Candidatus Amesbacteria bacterium GW2011_GWC2_45_19 TaxID=1618366 RepID=A0A0G1M3N9_9BACT|nr:MAG: Type IV secretory pathway VirB4 component-like protein [Candidatus Amesbacteria bacterium GW2011_GWC2_45_19]KKU37900.1 MAG: Type IV secretory pathway VirB4 component-like protein [Candidatus Amesbacteria bacterium GW2011_GWA1_46_35]KKU69353.1 MAG: Type IV secretory pathway VirB4 component-like protein [Microgenomates group bacterium GW2011_GWC1_47_20]KKU74332.1 MAG: Type IV secretory pathway VirB4 component-like protein [Candidatus Amesbacteria bacterium GW2011_GWB1_47_26]